MLKYQKLYRHLKEYHEAIERNDNSLVMSACSKMASDIEQNILEVVRNYPDADLTQYGELLAGYGLDISNQSLRNADVSELDLTGVLTLLVTLSRMDHMVERSLAYYFADQVPIPWLEKLQQLDIIQSLKEDAKLPTAFDTARIHIHVTDITKLDTDCIVNAANPHLKESSGICKAIFHAAGCSELQNACDEIGYCPVGESVYTPGFQLPARFIIHTAGPKYIDGHHGEPEQLAECYRSALKTAEKLNCKSIAFPLISSGSCGYPKEQAWMTAINACLNYVESCTNPWETIDITFTVIDRESEDLGKKCLEKCYFERWMKVFEKYIGIFELASQDEVLSKWCMTFNPYTDSAEEHSVLCRRINQFDDDCIRTGFAMSGKRKQPDTLSKLQKSPYYHTVLTSPEIIKHMSSQQLRSIIADYVQAYKFTMTSMYEGAGNGVFFSILKELYERYSK